MVVVFVYRGDLGCTFWLLGDWLVPIWTHISSEFTIQLLSGSFIRLNFIVQNHFRKGLKIHAWLNALLTCNLRPADLRSTTLGTILGDVFFGMYRYFPLWRGGNEFVKPCSISPRDIHATGAVRASGAHSCLCGCCVRCSGCQRN